MPDMDPLATTACWTAAIRAQESERVDRLSMIPGRLLLRAVRDPHGWSAWLAYREAVVTIQFVVIVGSVGE